MDVDRFAKTFPIDAGRENSVWEPDRQASEWQAPMQIELRNCYTFFFGRLHVHYSSNMCV